MAHEKVYGICEDKCKVEVLPKEQIEAVIDGILINMIPKFTSKRITVAPVNFTKNGLTWNRVEMQAVITPPTDFNPTNCMAILFVRRGGMWEQALSKATDVLNYYYNCAWKVNDQLEEVVSVLLNEEFIGSAGSTSVTMELGVLFVPLENTLLP